jgi:hypothetical protein
MATRSTKRQSKALAKDGLRSVRVKISGIPHNAICECGHENGYHRQSGKCDAGLGANHCFCQSFKPVLVSSGQIARHDPERIYRCQKAGRIALELRNKGFAELSEGDQVFIINLLSAMRDGKL